MSERTYLTTTFKEKDQVKALGARWDKEASQWYVPTGLSLEMFAAWLPAEALESLSSAASPIDASAVPASTVPGREVSAQIKGVPLSRLLSGVGDAVSNIFTEGVWTTAEILKTTTSKGHCYLELSERSEKGVVLAQARAIIWARMAQTIIPEFKRATGADLDAGIKVLLRARPVFNAQYGFSLEVDGIDASYTLGDLEARKREIRERLKSEGLYERNRRLPAPWDYNAVLVVAPQQAAGLGDFAREAERLQARGLCQFAYVNSRFQGEGSAAEMARVIRGALQAWAEPSLPDAVVIIRGGGSVSDLAWLNDYDLARCVCECEVPVLTGIGHERDSTVLDEVAHISFDTPSKVANGIEAKMLLRVQEAQSCFDAVVRAANSIADQAVLRVGRLRLEVISGAESALADARSDCAEAMSQLRLDSTRSVHRAHRSVALLFSDVRSGTVESVSHAKRLVPASMEAVKAESLMAIRTVNSSLRSTLPQVLERAHLVASRAREGAARSFDTVVDRSRLAVKTAASQSEGLVREISGQGPKKTLGRGFALVCASDGKTVTTSAAALDAQTIEVSFHDGSVTAQVSLQKSGDSNNKVC